MLQGGEGDRGASVGWTLGGPLGVLSLGCPLDVQVQLWSEQLRAADGRVRS